MSFCVAGVALRDIPACFTTCQTSYGVADAILWRRFQKMHCMYRGKRRTWETSDVFFAWQAQHLRRVVLHVFC